MNIGWVCCSTATTNNSTLEQKQKSVKQRSRTSSALMLWMKTGCFGRENFIYSAIQCWPWELHLQCYTVLALSIFFILATNDNDKVWFSMLHDIAVTRVADCPWSPAGLLYTRTHSLTHTRTHAHTHARTHTHTHTRTHTRTHVHTHAHTLALRASVRHQLTAMPINSGKSTLTLRVCIDQLYAYAAFFEKVNISWGQR